MFFAVCIKNSKNNGWIYTIYTLKEGEFLPETQQLDTSNLLTDFKLPRSIRAIWGYFKSKLNPLSLRLIKKQSGRVRETFDLRWSLSTASKSLTLSILSFSQKICNINRKFWKIERVSKNYLITKDSKVRKRANNKNETTKLCEYVSHVHVYYHNTARYFVTLHIL